jgi:trehalose/maltose hydrolase-like predicted phosphorylase
VDLGSEKTQDFFMQFQAIFATTKMSFAITFELQTVVFSCKNWLQMTIFLQGTCFLFTHFDLIHQKQFYDDVHHDRRL